jgi:dCTP deaminase
MAGNPRRAALVSFTPPDANGILPDRMIAAMAAAGLILPAYPFVESQIQPASLDLRLGDSRLSGARQFPARPGHRGRAHRRVEAARNRADRRRGAGNQLRLYRAAAGKPGAAADIVAAANPKSSTGRLDVFTRVIADGTRGFDMIGAGYHGPLYAEISPKTFPVLLREGSRLSQVRFRTGDAILGADELAALHCTWSGWSMRRRRSEQRRRAERRSFRREWASGFVGYRAKRHTGVIDIDRRAGYAVANSGSRSRRGPTAA